MHAENLERSGVLVVRAWIDERAGTGLRARIITLGAPPVIDTDYAVASGLEEIVLNVRQWLQHLEGSNNLKCHP